MCRPIRVVANPLLQTCKRPNVRSDDYAGAEALAFRSKLAARADDPKVRPA